MLSKWLEAKLVEMYLREKSMFWGASLVPDAQAKAAMGAPKDAGEITEHKSCHGFIHTCTNILYCFGLLVRVMRS